MNLDIFSKTFGRLVVIIDDEDYEKVTSIGKWSASFDREKFYFHKRTGKKIKITLHRFIMGLPKDGYVDHINGNTLDNRKINLRICSNGANLRKGRLRLNNKTGHTGISIAKDQPNHPYVSRIKVNYKTILLGSFKTLEEAVECRKTAERIYFDT